MSAAPNKTDEQLLDFDIKDVITNVNLALKHDANSPFRIDVGQYYYATSSGKLYHRPVKVTFAPRKAGVYEAELRVSVSWQICWLSNLRVFLRLLLQLI